MPREKTQATAGLPCLLFFFADAAEDCTMRLAALNELMTFLIEIQTKARKDYLKKAVVHFTRKNISTWI